MTVEIVENVGVSSSQVIDPAVKTAINEGIAEAEQKAKDEVATRFNEAFPVGSVYITVTDTNPGTFLPGTWVQFGAGRALVGINTSDSDFAYALQEGGAKTHTLTEAEMPRHRHVINENNGTSGSTWRLAAVQGGGTNSSMQTNYAGSGNAHSILQPYIVVYLWRRTT